MTLANKTWAPNTGVASLTKVRDADAKAHPVAAVAPQFKWTVNEQTSHYGVSVDRRSIKIDDAGKFSIDASNDYLRTLFAGYQLLDQSRNPIGDVQTLYSVGATNTIMGFPVPTDPTSLELNLGTAAGVQLKFGSLGVSNWEEVVSWRGALLTCLWQYGVPNYLPPGWQGDHPFLVFQ
jgi:hypothetical protein